MQEHLTSIFAIDTGNEDGALVFVVESNEHVVTYETQSVNASTSGAGWLALFITVVIVYSISCCVFGAFFVRKISSCDRLKGTRRKTVEGKCVNDTEENAVQAMTSDCSELDIENQMDSDDAETQ